MEKHYTCVIGICDNDMHTQSWIKSTVIWMEISSFIMHKLPKDGAVRAG